MSNLLRQSMQVARNGLLTGPSWSADACAACPTQPSYAASLPTSPVSSVVSLPLLLAPSHPTLTPLPMPPVFALPYEPLQDEKKKRKRGGADDDGWDSDDSDFDDLRGFERSGLSLALKGAKSVALAPSIAASLGGRSLGAKSAGGRSTGAKSAGGRSVASHAERSAKHHKGSQHSGDRFKAKKKGTGGWHVKLWG